MKFLCIKNPNALKIFTIAGKLVYIGCWVGLWWIVKGPPMAIDSGSVHHRQPTWFGVVSVCTVIASMTLYFCVLLCFLLVYFNFSYYGNMFELHVGIMEYDHTIIIFVFYGSTWCKWDEYHWQFKIFKCMKLQMFLKTVLMNNWKMRFTTLLM